MSTQVIEFEPGLMSDGDRDWISKGGQFHIVSYECSGSIRAYFKPSGWKSFGMGVRHIMDKRRWHGESQTTMSYGSFEDAVADCQKFFDEFGSEAHSGATL